MPPLSEPPYFIQPGKDTRQYNIGTAVAASRRPPQRLKAPDKCSICERSSWLYTGKEK